MDLKNMIVLQTVVDHAVSAEKCKNLKGTACPKCIGKGIRFMIARPWDRDTKGVPHCSIEGKKILAEILID